MVYTVNFGYNVNFLYSLQRYTTTYMCASPSSQNELATSEFIGFSPVYSE